MSGPAIPLGPFHLDRCIGRGGMAEVWSGIHTAQQVPVAVKVMTADRARETSFRASFRNEVQAVASLDHPGIVRVFEHGEIGAKGEEISRGLLAKGSPTLAMELADGTLADFFSGGITWPGLRQVLLGLLDALAHAHARGVVHRDLKPNNILVFRDGSGPPRLKLADFGLAQAFERQSRADSTEVVCGTPSYMAPEQLRGHWRDYGPWTDLYALGCLAWTLAAGGPPFGGTGLLETFRRQMEEDPPAFESQIPVPWGFEGWLRRLLQKNPGHRFVRAADAAWVLGELGDTEGDGPRPPSEVLLAEPTTVAISFTGLWPQASEATEEPSSQAAELPLPRRSPPLPATWEHPISRPASIRLIGAGLGLYGLRSIPLLDRHAERDRLWKTLAAVHTERRARLVLLHGPAGNGKSHLAEWLAERAHEVGGAIVLRASHGPNPGAEDGLPRMMVRHFRCGGLSREEVCQRTEVLLRARKETEPGEWHGLTELMIPGGGKMQTAPERFGLLERHFQRLARQRPVLAVFDDVQWGAESLAFARHLLERREESPLSVLLLLTARDEALAERPAEGEALAALLALPGAESLAVPALPREEGTALIREVLGLAGDLAAQVEARTGGNPLFAVQLVGDWVQRGVIQVGDSGFVLRPGSRAPIPEDLHQVWAGRVARLLEGQPPAAREVLEIAATLSPFVDRREWEGACRAAGVECPPTLLEELVTGRLALRTEEGWSFVHAMLRESIEEQAREAGRLGSHHRACAAMLRERRAAGERGVAERLGRHLLLAGDWEEALEPLLAGARERRETSDYPAALSLLAEREMALHQMAAPTSDSRWGKGWVLRARIHLHQGELAEVFRWTERAAAGEGEDWGGILSEALRLEGDAARRRGDLDRAAGFYERCIALPDNPHGAAASLWGLADVARQRGRGTEARTLLDRSLLLYRAIGDQHGLADHTLGQADLARQRRDFVTAQDLYSQARDRFAALGNRYGVSRGTNGLGDVARMRGDLGAARSEYSRSLALLEELRSADAVFPRLNLALCHLAAGHFRDAREILEENREILERWGWGGLLAAVHLGLLVCTSHSRDWPAWDGHLERVRATLAASASFDPDLAACAEQAGRLLDRAGQSPRAREAYAIALAQWQGLKDAEGRRRVEGAMEGL
ncbi:MAG TPA: protein kinase [Thermoanaerobaculia bacterium]|nr:protein kinase [Thermoanaerobaculia bacterium]